MREHTIKLYTYAELSDTAKERAREVFCRRDSGELGMGAGEWATEWVQDAGKYLGIEIDPKSWQWDAYRCEASCRATYAYAKGGAAKLKADFSADKTLHGIADRLQAAQKSCAYRATATIADSAYAHSLNYTISVDLNDTCWVDSPVEDALNEFMGWAARHIQTCYEDVYSEEQLAEHFECNEYEFTENGIPA